MRKMTKNQVKLLYFIIEYRQLHGTAPTLREMVKKLGVSDNKSILGIIEALTKQGYLKREKKKSRSVSLTDTEKAQKFRSDYLFPFQYRENPTVADQLLRQSRELERSNATVLSPTSGSLAYKKSTIKTNGTNLGNDLHTIVETAVSLAIDKYFNSTLSVEPNLRQSLIGSIVNVVCRAFTDKTIVGILGWGIILTGLTWANSVILEYGLTALVYSIIEIVVIKKLLNE